MYAFRQLGFKRYKDYLRSSLWASIRQRVFKIQPRCFNCSRRATQVHHKRYDIKTMRGEDLSGLIAMCRFCHPSIEWKGKRKRSRAQANFTAHARLRSNRQTTVMCPKCGINRKLRGGPCPPCIRRQQRGGRPTTGIL